MPSFSEKLADAAQMPLSSDEHVARLKALLQAIYAQNDLSAQATNGVFRDRINQKDVSVQDLSSKFDPLVTTPETERMLPSQQALREQTKAMKDWRATLDALQNADYTSDIEAKEEELRESNKDKYREAMLQALKNLSSKHHDEQTAQLVTGKLPAPYMLSTPYDAHGHYTPVGAYNPFYRKLIVGELIPALLGRPSKSSPTVKDNELEELLLNLSRQTNVRADGTKDGWGWDAPNPPPQDELQQILQYARNPTAPAREQVELNTANMYDVHPMHYDQFTQLVQGGMHPAMAAKQVGQGFDMSQPQYGDIQMSASPMDLAFRLLKMPFVSGHHENYPDEVIDQPLYSGGDMSDTPLYWTKSPQEALMYALYGSAVLNDTEPGNIHGYDRSRYPNEQDMETFTPPPLRQTVPTIFRADPPTHDEFINLDPKADDWYRNYMSNTIEHTQLSDEEVKKLIEEYLDEWGGASNAGWTSGAYYPTDMRNQHVKEALERLENKQAGMLELPKDVEDRYGWSKTDNKSEPMDLAFRLLKERKSPEAMRHKLEYDKQYESSPERVKYREELNRERRRRGIMGSHDHMDVSHTQGNKLTLESEHDNRARHFKNRGTLRQIDEVE